MEVAEVPLWGRALKGGSYFSEQLFSIQPGTCGALEEKEIERETIKVDKLI